MNNKKLLIVASLVGVGVYLITRSQSGTAKNTTPMRALTPPVQSKIDIQGWDKLQVIKK